MTRRIENGKERNLDFLREIITAKGMTMASFARAAGISQQLVYHYFTAKDDISLYNAQKHLSVIGIKLEVDFGKPYLADIRLDTEKQKNKYTILGDTPIRTNNLTPKYVRDSIKPEKRLCFLAKALDSLKLSEKELCDVLGVKRGLLMYMFENDDIKVSLLYKFAKRINRHIMWKVTNISPDENKTTPEQDATNKLISLVGPLDIIETTHTKGNRYRFRIKMKDDLDITKTKSVKILSVNAANQELLLEIIM